MTCSAEPQASMEIRATALSSKKSTMLQGIRASIIASQSFKNRPCNSDRHTYPHRARIKEEKQKNKKKKAKAKSRRWLQCKQFQSYTQLIMYTNKAGTDCQGNNFHMFALTVHSTKQIPLNRTIAYCLQDTSPNRCCDQI